MGGTKITAKLGTMVREIEKSYGFKNEIKWGTAAVIFGYHALAVWWCYHYAFPARWQTLAFAYGMYVVTGNGITAGVHRYWSHRSYKATRPLQYILFLMFAASGQTSVLRFVRNHRLHHKYSDTDADPHNAGRGMFFSHIGWIMMKKNAEAVSKGKQIDDSDITSDPLLMWHERHLAVVNLVLCFVLPTWFNVWAWDESWACAIAWQCFVRYLVVLHSGMSVNSLAHKYGHRPYNKTIKPAENFLVSVATLGEGFHNYHHAFPFDYKATDVFFTINTATLLIKGWEKLGMAYDLKEATPKMIENMAERLGDGFRLKEEFDAE